MSGTNIKIYRNDELLHDCTMCKNPEGRIGWWDAVDDTFHPREEEPTIREPMWAQYIDTGVFALREQEERSKGCSACDGGFGDNTMVFYAGGYKHCPMCGRRLEEV